MTISCTEVHHTTPYSICLLKQALVGSPPDLSFFPEVLLKSSHKIQPFFPLALNLLPFLISAPYLAPLAPSRLTQWTVVNFYFYLWAQKCYTPFYWKVTTGLTIAEEEFCGLVEFLEILFFCSAHTCLH